MSVLLLFLALEPPTPNDPDEVVLFEVMPKCGVDADIPDDNVEALGEYGKDGERTAAVLDVVKVPKRGPHGNFNLSSDVKSSVVALLYRERLQFLACAQMMARYNNGEE